MDETAPVNIYPENWPEIRERIRMQRGFRCEECRIDLSSHRRFLHLHHRNAQMNENEDDNLVLLCIEHHVVQPSHGHMRNSADLVEFLHLLRSGHIARR